MTGFPAEGTPMAGGHTAPVVRLGNTVRRRPLGRVRLADLIDYSYREAAAGSAALQFTIDAGHVALYEGDLLWVESLLADARHGAR